MVAVIVAHIALFSHIWLVWLYKSTTYLCRSSIECKDAYHLQRWHWV